MNRDALIVLQARFASRRLPGKALTPLEGQTILARCLARLRAGAAAPVVLATTTHPEDDAVAAVAISAGVPVVRGSEHDVLGRFVLAAETFNASCILRATADNPAVDIDAPGRVLDAMLSFGVDYVVEGGLPYGCAVEAVTYDALRKADAMATDPSDREHVTPLIKKNRLFSALEIAAPRSVRRPDLRLSIDTLHDLAYMRGVMRLLDEPRADAPLTAIIAAADEMARDVMAVAQ